MREIVSHTADIGLKIRAESLDDLFVEAMFGFREIAFERIHFLRSFSGVITVSGASYEELLVALLNELNFLLETESVLPEKIQKIEWEKTNNRYRLRCHIIEGRIDWEHSSFNTEIKSVTYHNLKIVKDANGRYECTVYFDL